jgi:hypothetical protein
MHEDDKKLLEDLEDTLMSVSPSHWRKAEDEETPRERQLQCHRNLMAEILRRVVLDATSEDLLATSDGIFVNNKIQLEAIDWICVEHSEYVFSFPSICDYLGLNKNQVRKLIFKQASVVSRYKNPKTPGGAVVSQPGWYYN